ncbi:MAG: uracil phosphoribosyltransferase [Flavobacteriales bacterium]|nr:uracil phosphoribosyltransferase [Flavobacteriales bacterium]
MIHELTRQPSALAEILGQLRDEQVQKDSLRFRFNLERVGEIIAYEISKTLTYSVREINTPLGVADISELTEQPVLLTILRAGLPFHQGMLRVLDKAENAFVSAYRRHHKGGEFEIDVEYVSAPTLEGKTVIISDPMIATGMSIEMVYKALLRKGTPSRLHIASVIATDSGINHLRSKLPEHTTYWTAAIDKELTAQAYIVPGLGDAGDLAFGRKD